MTELSKNQQIIAEVLAAHGRLHAYEIKRLLVDRLGQTSVYKALSAMEHKGVVVPEWEDADEAAQEGRPRRKYVELTALGLEALEIARVKDRAALRYAALVARRQQGGAV